MDPTGTDIVLIQVFIYPVQPDFRESSSSCIDRYQCFTPSPKIVCPLNWLIELITMLIRMTRQTESATLSLQLTNSKNRLSFYARPLWRYPATVTTQVIPGKKNCIGSPFDLTGTLIIAATGRVIFCIGPWNPLRCKRTKNNQDRGKK